MNISQTIARNVAMTRADREAIWPTRFIYTGSGRECNECFAFSGHTGRCDKTK